MHAIKTWFIIPDWQNFSSLVRESKSASGCKNGIEISHHLTSSLYFGVAALEAFINSKMRAHLSETKSIDEIYKKLKNEHLSKKLKKWPEEIFGHHFEFNENLINTIINLKDMRNALTHPNINIYETYEDITNITPQHIIDTISEYIVNYHEFSNTHYPYWIFGWNYISPDFDTHEIIVINEESFLHSLQSLGFAAPRNCIQNKDWRDYHLGTFAGYLIIKGFLNSISHCEPKSPRFPWKPILCRKWWSESHQKTCGSVTEHALALANKLDRNSQHNKPGTPHKEIAISKEIESIRTLFSKIKHSIKKYTTT
ncbi:MAG TPA: hypothetical protein VE028_07910 [Nitratidesulfovibrio sp.]|nr:hypothetical protein [Nitratidesulfovibrio sp.]